VFKLGSSWDTLEEVLFWGIKVKGQGHGVNKSILYTKTMIHRHSLGGVTTKQQPNYAQKHKSKSDSPTVHTSSI